MKEISTAEGFKAGATPEGQEAEQKTVPTKKVVSALLTALEHKLGREPTASELAEALTTQEDPTAEQEQMEKEQEEASLPRCLSYKIYYGLKTNQDGSKEPAPDRPIFYGNEDDTQWFDVDEGQWLVEKPRYLDHLQSRVLGDSDSQRDLFDALVAGVVDDSDYEKLAAQPGMLDHRCERAYELVKRANEQAIAIQEMEKSLAPAEDQEQFGDDLREVGQNNISDMLQAAGLSDDTPMAVAEEQYEGAGGGPKMVEQATGPGIEYRIRRWIQEEIRNSMPMVVEHLMAMIGDDEGMEKADATVSTPPPKKPMVGPPTPGSDPEEPANEPAQVTGVY